MNGAFAGFTKDDTEDNNTTFVLKHEFPTTIFRYYFEQAIYMTNHHLLRMKSSHIKLKSIYNIKIYIKKSHFYFILLAFAAG